MTQDPTRKQTPCRGADAEEEEVCVRAEGVALHLDGSGACVDESKGEVRSGPAGRAGAGAQENFPDRGCVWDPQISLSKLFRRVR